MSREMFSYCKQCGQGFFYQRKGYHSRPRVFCDRCLSEHKREANRERQRAYRARQREAKISQLKQPSDNPPRPVAIGTRASVARTAPATPEGGLYADMPNPGRTAKRKAIGLP